MTLAIQDDELTRQELDQLQQCEQKIGHLRQAFADAGAALREIRDSRLYRQDYGTFEEYCQQHWGMQRAHAYRLIDAAQVSESLSPIGDILLPDSESQVRPLAKLETPEQQQEAWRRAVEASGGRPTGAVVAQAVQGMRQPSPEPEPEQEIVPVAPLSHEPPRLKDRPMAFQFTDEMQSNLSKRGYMFFSLMPPNCIRFADTNLPLSPSGGYVIVTLDRRQIEIILQQPEKQPEPESEPWPEELVEELEWMMAWPPAERFENGRREYCVHIPTGVGNTIPFGWYPRDYLIQEAGKQVEKLCAEVDELTKRLKKYRYEVRGVDWKVFDKRRLPVWTVHQFGKTCSVDVEWNRDQVEHLVRIHDFHTQKVEELKQEIDKARKKCGQLDVQRHGLEQELKRLRALAGVQ